MRGFHCIEWHCLTSSHSWLLLWRCPQQLQKNKVGRVAVSIGSGLSHLRTRDDFNILCCNKAFAVILSADVEWRNPIVSVYVNVFFSSSFFFIHLLPHQHQGKCANSFVYFSLSFNKITKISTLMCRRVCLKCRVCLSLGLGGVLFWGCTLLGSIIFWGCTSGGVYVPCIYTHARWVTVGDSGLCCTCVTYFER